MKTDRLQDGNIRELSMLAIKEIKGIIVQYY